MPKFNKHTAIKVADATVTTVVAVTTGMAGLKAKKAIEAKIQSRTTDNVVSLDEALDQVSA